jgi:26S proteasome regulatory subunit N2
VTGEAAGIAMGLVELGSKSAAAIEDMVAYAQVPVFRNIRF